jgi:hypothetical protein
MRSHCILGAFVDLTEFNKSHRAHKQEVIKTACQQLLQAGLLQSIEEKRSCRLVAVSVSSNNNSLHMLTESVRKAVVRRVFTWAKRMFCRWQQRNSWNSPKSLEEWAFFWTNTRVSTNSRPLESTPEAIRRRWANSLYLCSQSLHQMHSFTYMCLYMCVCVCVRSVRKCPSLLLLLLLL